MVPKWLEGQMFPFRSQAQYMSQDDALMRANVDATRIRPQHCCHDHKKSRIVATVPVLAVGIAHRSQRLEAIPVSGANGDGL